MDNTGTKGFKTLQKVKDMMLYAYPALAQFPKSERYAMVTDMKRLMDEILGNCIDVEKKASKKTALEKMDNALAKLKVYVDLSHELGFLPHRKYGEWSRYNEEIGRMIGGLLASVAKQSNYHRE